MPRALLAAGFEFTYPTLEQALAGGLNSRSQPLADGR